MANAIILKPLRSLVGGPDRGDGGEIDFTITTPTCQ